MCTVRDKRPESLELPQPCKSPVYGTCNKVEIEMIIVYCYCYRRLPKLDISLQRRSRVVAASIYSAI